MIDLMATIRTKRIYVRPGPEDGCRVLVDRLWPRGLAKEWAAVDHWFKDVAPSPGLRRWFSHDPTRWAAFRDRYRAELAADDSPISPLRALLTTEKTITLLFAARDESHNNAIVLADYLGTS